MSNPMYENRPRHAGILLHITSLPGPYGIGDLGYTARSFADFLSNAGVIRTNMRMPITPKLVKKIEVANFDRNALNETVNEHISIAKLNVKPATAI